LATNASGTCDGAIATSAVPPRDLVDHHEADVVPRVAILAAGIAKPTISFT
jgi:hypothetical protein